MPRYVEDGDCLYVHASPLDPTKEYVMPEACHNLEYMKLLFNRVRRVAFGGHTHLPGIFRPGQPFLSQDQVDGPFPVIDGRFFVNVGSVGQPRDGDARACYVIFDNYFVTFRRIAYDHRKTARKIKQIPRLPDALGSRLAQGL
jgi:diadenosine tetraphosphatase ApaH/serine/threonine PP2A family protein phosphatase